MASSNQEMNNMNRIISASMFILLPSAAIASSVVVVPEPGTLGLLALAIGAAAFVVGRGRRK